MTDRLNIVALEPFFGGSHRQWLEGLKNHSIHSVEIFSLPARLWKWRMNGAAVTFAKKASALEKAPDLFLATDLLDVATFRGLLPKHFKNIPLVTYFHENQFAYPWQAKEKPAQHDVHNVKHFDLQYLFKNYTSALSSDRCFFNSRYNLKSFLAGLEKLLDRLPDHTHKEDIQNLREKFQVLPLGIDLPETQTPRTGKKIIWNHRWEYDKNPEEFFAILRDLKENGEDFALSLLGTRAQKHPTIFEKARDEFAGEIQSFEQKESREDYLQELESGTIALTTSKQEFFGISVVEAINAGNLPLLPDRLSYPEIVPSELHETFLYRNPKEAREKMQAFLHSPEGFHGELKKLQTELQKYRWENMIETYDNFFSSSQVNHGLLF